MQNRVKGKVLSDTFYLINAVVLFVSVNSFLFSFFILKISVTIKEKKKRAMKMGCIVPLSDQRAQEENKEERTNF